MTCQHIYRNNADYVYTSAKKIESSAFLLGPRGTGKSTWIKKNYTDNTISYDVL